MGTVFNENNQTVVSGADTFAEQSEKEVLGSLRTSHRGLSQAEAEKRLKRYGYNTVEKKKRFRTLLRILSQLRNPVVAILLFSSIFLYLIDYAVDANIILAALVINIVIAVLQEGKVSRAFDLLRQVDQLYTLVIRDGKQMKVPVNRTVPGDIVLFEAGSCIPADVRVLRQNNLQVNESILTGEWAPIDKQAVTLANRRPLAEMVNMVWKGTTVISGTGRGVVVSTGAYTAVGDIARHLGGGEAKTPLQLQTQKLAQWIMTLVLLSVLGIVIIASLQGVPFNEIVITSIAVAIAGIPSGLPAAITVVLVLGMQSVLKNNGLVRNMLAAETLGGTTWILTDKTGTLTNGHMTLSEIVTLEGRERVSDDSISSFGRDTVLGAYLGTDGKRLYRHAGDAEEIVFSGSAIEQAFVRACEEVCTVPANRERRSRYLPFDSERRYSAALFREQSGSISYCAVGAPEVLITRAERVVVKGRVTVMTEQRRAQLEVLLAEEAAQGKRVLAICRADFSGTEENADLTLEHRGAAFTAFLSLEDTVRADVPESIGYIRGAHVTLTMVTGDNAHTALHIARESGIVGAGDSDEVLLGDAIRDLTDEALFAKAKTVRVFARMLPEQKSRLLRVLLDRGEVVAMTGDGVNDAPALQRASIGIAVASGTDVAKEASDLILLKNSFSTITSSIIEGKKIIRNLKKILIYLLSTSFSEVVLVAGGLLTTGLLPITPVQILWANIVEEAFVAFAFAFEKEDADVAQSDPRDERASTIISKEVRHAVIALSVLTGLFLLSVYTLLSFLTDFSIEQIQTIMFLMVSVDSIFFALSLKRLNKSILRTNLFDNWWLIGAIALSIGILGVAFVISPLAGLLSLVSVPAWVFLLIPGSALFHITIVETVKLFLFKKGSLPLKRGALYSGARG